MRLTRACARRWRRPSQRQTSLAERESSRRNRWCCPGGFRCCQSVHHDPRHRQAARLPNRSPSRQANDDSDANMLAMPDSESAYSHIAIGRAIWSDAQTVEGQNCWTDQMSYHVS
eukprot:3750803-Rhodomonas_salina.1